MKPRPLYRRFPALAQREIASRSTDMTGRVWCEKCGAECSTRADYEIDHIVAEGVLPAFRDRRPLTAADGALLCLSCHGKKTRGDIFEIARAKRLEARHRVVAQGQPEIMRRWAQ